MPRGRVLAGAILLVLALSSWRCFAQPTSGPSLAAPGNVTEHSEGLHGYISFHSEMPPEAARFSAGIGFYTAVWPLADQPLADFQIGLPGTWILPDNSDDKDQPLAPDGTLARTWKERGPTWGSVFQTIEGGIGLWAGNHFRYGLPKFSMNGTPQCYDYEIGSPGWSFFYSAEPLADNRLGIAQLSNRLLIPPDGLPFAGQPAGQFLGYSWLALPFTAGSPGDPPTGDQSWTCFLHAANFKGPIAFYIPETWSKIGKLFNYPYLYGRGLDARPGTMGGGAIEINTMPRLDSADAKGVVYSRIPALRFPTDEHGRTLLVQDVTYYSKAALYEVFKRWRDGGPACPGAFDIRGAMKPRLTTQPTAYQQAGKDVEGVENLVSTKVFDGNIWGLQWASSAPGARGEFPQYFREQNRRRVAVAAADVPAETKLHERQFRTASKGQRYIRPQSAAWSNPGPATGASTVRLVDGSTVRYVWYRFVDQPAFYQYHWPDDKKAKLQALIESIHRNWTIDQVYMAPPGRGQIVSLDPALLVTPPAGLEAGYVPIVIEQAASE